MQRLRIHRYFFSLLVAFLIVYPAYGEQASNKDGWGQFDASAGDESTFSFGPYGVTIKPRDINLPAPDREDKLTMIVKRNGHIIATHDFISSYGSGMILIKSGYIFLEYGLGRGTSVREEHIKAYTLLPQDDQTKEIVEVFDIQKSYRLPNPKPVASPAYVQYKVRFVEAKDFIKMIFYNPDKGFGLPESKEARLNRLSNE
jgi:hypothetical protein